MKIQAKEFLLAAGMGLVIPALLLSAVVRLGKTGQKSGTDHAALPGAEQTPPQPTDPAMQIPVLFDTGEVRYMDLETYLCGVVLAEIPVNFEPEAQKAQAVVARTYALRLYESGTKHREGAVCTDPNCCQGYISQTDFLAKGGTQDGIGKIQKAVLDTAGEVLTYQQALIEATYFSCSGGMTEDAAAVWGNDIPYLQATPSPGEEYAAHYTDTFVFSQEDFCNALGIPDPGRGNLTVGAVSRTTGGGVAELSIGNRIFTGVEMRRLLNLSSTDFTVSVGGGSVSIVTSGFGHRVGMSQYGADAMAVSGSTYQQILAHFYRGTELMSYPLD